MADQDGFESLRLTLDEEARMGARIKVVGVGGLADHVSNPAFATAVGLVLYAARHRGPSISTAGGGALTRVMGRLRTVFKEFF